MRIPLLLIAAAGLPVLGQDDKDWLSVKEWWGTLEITKTSEGSIRDGDGEEYTKNEWSEHETAYFTFHLDTRSAGPTVSRRGHSYSSAERAEPERWQSWLNYKQSDVDFALEGDGLSKTFAQDLNEARMAICDTRTETWTRVGVSSTSATIELQVDIKNKRYAFEAPVLKAFYAPEIKSYGRLNTLHTQEFNGTRIEDSGDTDGGSVRGTPKDAPADGEADSGKLRVLNQPLPEGVGKLSGFMKFPMDPGPLPKGRGSTKDTLLVTWSFSATPPPPIELELEAEADGAPLEKWRPKGGPIEEVPGSFVKLTATVVARGGGELPDKPHYISIRLLSSSREKGLCMNYPVKPAEPTEYDFKFREAENGRRRLSDQHVRVMEPKGTDLVATLACFDYGAWGEVIATARLQSGRRLVSVVKGKPGEQKLRLPDRRPGSKIATVWNAAGPDVSDDDPQPVGDRNYKGDGLSTYEEYRGFMVQGAWTDTDPAKKDFFIRNEAGGVAVAGINLFKTLSNLEVRLLAADEFPEDRVINRNRTDGPNVGEQHGIRVIFHPDILGFCQAVSTTGKPGLPKDVTFVKIDITPPNLVEANAGGGAKKWMAYSTPTVAHELFHCCTVVHHGKEAPGYGSEEVWIQEPSGDITERGVKITVLDEDGTDARPSLIWLNTKPKKSMVVVVHTWGGTSSGDTSCVMRYDNAEAFIPNGAPAGERRMITGEEERTGSGLCTSANATGTNLARGALPARFGPAAANRGNCAGQIVVNDMSGAPPR